MENKILLCPHNYCYSLPKISLLDNCSSMLITCNEHKGSNKHICEISDYFSREKLLLCTNCSKAINENQFFFFVINVIIYCVTNAIIKYILIIRIPF